LAAGRFLPGKNFLPRRGGALNAVPDGQRLPARLMVTIMSIHPRRRSIEGLACCVLGAVLVAALPGPATGAGGIAELAPHRASYRMVLKSVRGGSGVLDAQGATLYRFAETCDAWVVETNIYLKMGYAGDQELRITWSFAALESKNGLDYRFRLKHKRGGETVELLRGTATLDTPGGSGRARFVGGSNGDPGKSDSAPAEASADITVDLPSGTLFPTKHLLALLKAGREGKRFLPRVVFDGASLDNPFNVTATIAGAETAAIGAPVRALAQAAGLADLPARAIRMAFFPVRSRTPEPDFEVAVDYRADGLATKVTHDYGDFSIDMTPTEIEVLPRPEC